MNHWGRKDIKIVKEERSSLGNGLETHKAELSSEEIHYFKLKAENKKRNKRTTSWHGFYSTHLHFPLLPEFQEVDRSKGLKTSQEISENKEKEPRDTLSKFKQFDNLKLSSSYDPLPGFSAHKPPRSSAAAPGSPNSQPLSSARLNYVPSLKRTSARGLPPVPTEALIFQLKPIQEGHLTFKKRRRWIILDSTNLYIFKGVEVCSLFLPFLLSSFPFSFFFSFCVSSPLPSFLFVSFCSLPLSFFFCLSLIPLPSYPFRLYLSSFSYSSSFSLSLSHLLALFAACSFIVICLFPVPSPFLFPLFSPSSPSHPVSFLLLLSPNPPSPNEPGSP